MVIENINICESVALIQKSRSKVGSRTFLKLLLMFYGIIEIGEFLLRRDLDGDFSKIPANYEG